MSFYSDQGVTDIVLFGDERPVHKAAIAEARRAGLPKCAESLVV